MKSFVSLVYALDYIEDNLRRRITVNDVAYASYASISHLQSMFMRTLHVSIGDYVAKRKLCLAARDLIDTQKRVTDIAFDFGYSNVESFIRAFKKQFLCTPLVYRKTYKFSELYPPLNIYQKEGFSMVKKYDLAEISEQILASKGTYVICVDIDQMLAINDEIGYAAGDAAIAETAARIGRSIGEGMQYYRIGGDSFAVLTQSQDMKVAETIAQTIISFAEDDVSWSGGTFRFSLSMGIAKIPLTIKNAEDTLLRSEEAMISAKHHGRNCYKVM